MPTAALRHRRRVFPPVLAALVALAWLGLWLWTASPWGRYLDHGAWTSAGPAAALCRVLPSAAWWLPAGFAAAAWVLMIAAMMLPTTLPLFDAFDRLVAHRADRGRLLWLLGLGYVSAWAAFGLLAHAAHAQLLAAATSLPALQWNAWAVGAATLALAGAFQFSALKRRCLDKCRTPLGFVVEHWHGRGEARAAFLLGAHHGLFCIGCCWALMLLMFVLGMGSLGWMLLLAAAMAVEKNFAWGERLAAPLGAGLLGAAALLALRHL